MMVLKGLYAITDSKLTPKESILDLVRSAITGGAKIIQLRDKEKTDRELKDLAEKLCLLCREMDAIFMVNDRPELAAGIGAHGVHIGKDDTDISTARKLLPGGIIGVSCYNSIERAVEMERRGADYVAFGSLFPSPTKPGAVKAPLSLVQNAKMRLKIPVCGIGGITPENAKLAVDAGADMVAVISSLWKAASVKEQAQRFSRLFKT